LDSRSAQRVSKAPACSALTGNRFMATKHLFVCVCVCV